MVLLHVKIQLVGIKNYVLAASDIYGNLENRPPINEKKNRIDPEKCEICTLDIMIAFRWKNEANRWTSEIFLIRAYPDSVRGAKSYHVITFGQSDEL